MEYKEGESQLVISTDRFSGLALTIFVFASLLASDTAGNLYAQQYSLNSPAVLLSGRPPVIKQVQIALRQRGYYAGAVDGFMGQQTQTAIQRFQLDHCQRVAPLITRQLLVSLGIELEGKSTASPDVGRPPTVD
jgi:peptidoglycan hydrolase-like protein with peptidoglycan-binding domain